MARRGNGEGSIGKVKGRDLYVARYHVDLPDGTHKRRAIYGKTREEVRDKLAEVLGDAAKGMSYHDYNLKIGDYLDGWLADSVRDTVRERTFERYEQLVRIHIKPALGRTKLRKLTPAHLRGLYRSKLDEGLSPRTVQYIHTTLHKALKQAMLDGLVPRNVAGAVKPPKPVAKEVRVLDEGEVRRFLDAARGERLEALFVLALATGMRRGELMGLKWSDADLEAGKLSVRRSLSITKVGPTFTDTKRKSSRRSIRLAQRAVEALRTHRKRQIEEQLRAGAEWRDNGLVFPGEKGQPLTPRMLYRVAFKRVLKRAGLPDTITFHEATRHTCATLLLGKGVHPKIVQELLGHSNIAITLDTYSHVLPGMHDGLAETIDKALA
jgi:integrase